MAGGLDELLGRRKGLCGLDQHEVLRWRSWYRWTTLAMRPTPFW
jgi:hypothetical protein